MRKKLSIASILRIVGVGVLITTIALGGIIYSLTQSTTGVLICLLTAAVLSVWAFLLVHILQERLSIFINDICRQIDEMTKGENIPETIFDEDTMLDRVSHQLSRLYQMLQTNKEAIEEQKKELQGLVSDISHQVKTPATNLKMAAASLLEQELPRNQQMELLRSMNTQLDKLDFLMNAMVKSSRLETGVITLEKRPSSIYETLAIALGGIFMKAEEKNLDVTVDCPDDLILPHDSKWTAEALFNVLENAVKYMPAGGRIQVKVIMWEAYTKIEISDTGRGIPESQQAAIFKRFYREPEVHSIEGIGIGLYLTREIIAKQNGYMKVISSPGNGATFSIFLPND